MKKNDPAVAVRQLVHREIGRIVVWLFHEFKLTKAAVAHRMKFLDLLDHVRRVEVHKAKRNDLGRILLRRVEDDFSICKRREHTCREIQLLRYSQEVVDEIGVFLVEVHVHVHDAAGCGGRIGRRTV